MIQKTYIFNQIRQNMLKFRLRHLGALWSSTSHSVFWSKILHLQNGMNSL